MTTTSRKFFKSATEAAQYLFAQGFELVDISVPFAWGNFPKEKAAAIRQDRQGYFFVVFTSI